MPASPESRTYTGIHCEMTISRPSEGVALVVINGCDVGEFGDLPFHELTSDLADGAPIEIFVDARDTTAASVDVSLDWAQWMILHRKHIHRLNMLCSSRYIEVTALFVKRFTEFGSRMRIYSDAAAFEEALRIARG